MAWEEIGSVYVDAGIVMIGDPCYTLSDNASHRNDIAKSWDKFCKAIKDDLSEPFGPGTAIVIPSGYGDGEYPVYVKKDSVGRIMKVMVDFGDE